jgi:hypothetical protein
MEGDYQRDRDTAQALDIRTIALSLALRCTAHRNRYVLAVDEMGFMILQS